MARVQQDGAENIGSRLLRLLTPPAFPGDEEKTRRAVILNAALLFTIALVAVFCVGDVLGGKIPVAILGLDVFWVLACLGLRYLMQRGLVDWVGRLSLALAIISNTFSVAAVGTIRTPATTIYMLVVVVGGMLFDLPGVVATTGASSLAVLALIVAERAGALPPPDYSVATTQWFTLTALFGLVGGLTHYALQSMRQALSRADQEIAERRRVEEELASERNLMRTLIDNLPDQVFVKDDQGRLILSNERYARDRGTSPQALVGQTDYDIYPAETAARFYADDQTILRTGNAVEDREETFGDSPGTRRVLLVTKLPLRDRENRVVGVVGLKRDVTEQRAAEKSIASLAAIVESSDDAIYATDSYGIVTSWNRAAERIYGYSLDEILGRPVDVIVPDSHRGEVPQNLGAIMRGESVRPYETMRLRKDGTTIAVAVTVSPIRDDAGRILGASAVARDITERKRAEETLRQFELMVNHSRDIILFLEREGGRILWANAAAAEAYGYSRDELRSLSISDLRAPDTRALVKEQMEQADSAGILFETNHRSKGGRVFPVEVSSRGATIAGARTLISVIRDISERKQAEQALRRAEEKYRTIVEHAVEGIFQSSPAGRFLTVNPALAHMWGYASPEDLISSVTDIARQIYAEPARREEFRRAMAREGKVQGFEYLARRKDGTEMWVSENARAVLNAAGEIVHYEGTIEDITARKRVEAELQYASTHDALTGLYNRIFFDAELRRMQDDRCAPVSIIMSDVNGLKQLNDEYGHAEGDELLRRAARVFRAAFRAVDIVARIGGDEFAVILPNMDEHAAEAAVDRMRICVQAENRDAAGISLRLALGVATNSGNQPLIDVLRNADERMYEDKVRQQES